jgi:hypothetical protein
MQAHVGPPATGRSGWAPAPGIKLITWLDQPTFRPSYWLPAPGQVVELGRRCGVASDNANVQASYVDHHSKLSPQCKSDQIHNDLLGASVDSYC